MSNEITLEKYNELLDKYNEVVNERDTYKNQCETFTSEIANKDEKIKNLNDALYNSIITRQKPAGDNASDDPKTFDDLLREAFQGNTQ